MDIPSDPLAGILNYLPITSELASAGQPTEAQLAAIAQAGFEVVVNLATPTSTNALADEAGLVKTLGMTYVPIPVVWEHPTALNLAEFFDALDEHRGQKLFVHCALNWRAAAFIYLYRVIRLGAAHETAVRDLHSIWQPDATWSQFIADALERYGTERPPAV